MSDKKVIPDGCSFFNFYQSRINFYLLIIVYEAPYGMVTSSVKKTTALPCGTQLISAFDTFDKLCKGIDITKTVNYVDPDGTISKPYSLARIELQSIEPDYTYKNNDENDPDYKYNGTVIRFWKPGQEDKQDA